MALFRAQPTTMEILLSYIYNYVILATFFSLTFVYYLFRTRAPLKEKETLPEPSHQVDEHETESHEPRGKVRNGTAAKAVMANGSVDVAEGDQELLETILHGMNLADAAAAEDEADEAQEVQRNPRSRKATENEEEEDEGESAPRRRQVIREVTVRKIFLPPDARYTDVENAAKRLIGDAQTGTPRKDSDTGGTEFRTAIKNIREASKRLEDDDLSPVPRG